ncbi:MAG TPA: glycoside hydrolase family 65 protein, partial [Pelobium sp.]
MKDYIIKNEWNIIEEGFDPHLNKISESIFSLGNGRMGQRANFEESYSGETLSGNYVAGVYYPDKTRVGWWKNGYPEYFAKVLNAANWIGIGIKIGSEELDLAKAKVCDFKRVLNMREGYLERSFTAELNSGKKVKVSAMRFCSIVDDEVGAIKYSITPLNFNAKIELSPFIDGNVKNEDSNYDEKFWDFVNDEITNNEAYLTLRTKKTNFEVCTASFVQLVIDEKSLDFKSEAIKKEKFVAQKITVEAKQNQQVSLVKIAANLSSENHPKAQLLNHAKAVIEKAAAKGFDKLKLEQKQAWGTKWEQSDIVINGDVAAQQAIRFNIFQLFQTYTG